jgi:hypothetical protein
MRAVHCQGKNRIKDAGGTRHEKWRKSRKSRKVIEEPADHKEQKQGWWGRPEKHVPGRQAEHLVLPEHQRKTTENHREQAEHYKRPKPDH